MDYISEIIKAYQEIIKAKDKEIEDLKSIINKNILPFNNNFYSYSTEEIVKPTKKKNKWRIKF